MKKCKKIVIICAVLMCTITSCSPPSRHSVENYGLIYGKKFEEIPSAIKKRVLIINHAYRDERRIIHPSTYSIMGYWCSYDGQSEFCQPRLVGRDIMQTLRNATSNNEYFLVTHVASEIKSICSQKDGLLPLLCDAEILEYQSGWICGPAYTISATVEIMFKIFNHKDELLYDDIIRTDLTRKSCCSVTKEDQIDLLEKAKFETFLKLISGPKFENIIQKNEELSKPELLSWSESLFENDDRKSNTNPKDTSASMGTGFFIHENGYLVTAAHVIEGAGKVEVWTAGKKYPAKVVVKDAEIDAVILKVEGYRPGTILALASSAAVKVGDEVFTMGFPNIELQGSEAKYTDGSISSLTGAGDSPRMFQISVAVQPGNSGGPLLDSHGNVVGVVIAKLRAEAALATSGALPENVNYAVKSSFVLPLLEAVPELAGSIKSYTDKKPNQDRSAVIEKTKYAVALVVCY